MEEENNPLKLTEFEKLALKVYGGTAPGHYRLGKIATTKKAYEMLNAMFFDGIDNELTRIIDDEHPLYPAFIKQSDSMLEVLEALYSAMYKCGKKHVNTAYCYRVERLQAVNEMRERRETISNFSTSTIEYDVFEFGKKETILLEVDIKPGVPCVNFREEFNNKEYGNYEEGEILVAPFCPVKVEQMEITTQETGLISKLCYSPIGKLKVTVSAPEKAKPLTEEEQQDKVKQITIYKDSDLQKRAMEILQKILDEAELGKSSKEEVRRILKKEEIENYTKWKSAFLAVVKYRFREIALEIEAALEEKSKYNPEDVLELSEQEIEMMNSEAVGEILKTTVTTGDTETQIENNSIGEQ